MKTVRFSIVRHYAKWLYNFGTPFATTRVWPQKDTVRMKQLIAVATFKKEILDGLGM